MNFRFSRHTRTQLQTGKRSSIGTEKRSNATITTSTGILAAETKIITNAATVATETRNNAATEVQETETRIRKKEETVAKGLRVAVE